LPSLTLSQIATVVGLIAAGGGLITFTAGTVWFVIKLVVDPIRSRLAEEIRKREEAATAPLTATAIGQKVHDMAGSMTVHYQQDDERFARIESIVADGRKENLDNFAELRKSLAHKRGAR
jgi:hypothetical protein